MKDTMQATGTGATNTYMFPITMEEVTARMNAFKATAPEAGGQKRKGWRVESARRDAWYEVTTAKARLARRQMEYGADPAGEATGEHALKSEIDLECMATCSRLGIIFDHVALAAEDRDNEIGDAPPVAAFMADMNEKAAALDQRIAELSARKVTVLHGKITRLGNELRYLVEVMMHGQWKKAAPADRPEMLAIELNRLASEGRYTGPVTEDAARARLEEIERELDTLNEAKRTALTDGEGRELAKAEMERAAIDAAILKAMPEFEKSAAIERAAVEKFEARFEASMIDAACVVEVHLIDCERIALG